MSRNLYTTIEAAQAAEIPRATLQHWIATHKISAPKVQLRSGKAVRLWTEADIGRVRKLKGTLKPGPRSKKKT
jgi:DNA-binding transcriptional MerR regulator